MSSPSSETREGSSEISEPSEENRVGKGFDCNGTPGKVVDIDTVAFLERHKAWKAREGKLSEINCKSLPELKLILSNWLYLEPVDDDFIDVTIAATLDREIQGDPVWLYVIAPPGGLKSEILRALGQSYQSAYTLDTLTTSTFISGLAEKDKETGEWVPVAGVLQDLDGKTVIVKDFTTILNKSEDHRTEIFGQLRSIYDGYYEQAFGTMRRKVSVKAKISLVVGVTPIIDRYTKLQSALGERFLKIRSVPNRLEATRVALKNEGREVEMREQILKAMKTYLSNLSFDVVPHITPEQDEFLLKLAYYTAYMRANTWRTYDEHGRVIDAEVDGTEVPTRIAKQFRHLSKLLAIVRGRVEVTKAELTTIRRVARDTTDPKRQAILDFMQTYSWGVSHRLTDIAGAVDGLYRSSVGNHLQIMEALRILKHGGDDEVPTWMVDQNFVPFAESAYATSPPVPLRNTPDLRLFSNGTPIRVSTPVDEKRLIRIATEYINREEGSVGRILFFSTMLEAGFDENTVIRVLTKEQCWDIRLNSINYHPQVTPDNF